MAEHALKCWPIWFNDALSGAKTFEVRRNDRPFCAGDVLRLREWARWDGYSGRECRRRIDYVTDLADFGIDGFVGMSISDDEKLARAVAAEQRVAEVEDELSREIAHTVTLKEDIEAGEAERGALRDTLVHVRGLLPHIAHGDNPIRVGNQAHAMIEQALAASVSKEEARDGE
jgi:hypothetical protein